MKIEILESKTILDLLEQVDNLKNEYKDKNVIVNVNVFHNRINEKETAIISSYE